MSRSFSAFVTCFCLLLVNLLILLSYYLGISLCLVLLYCRSVVVLLVWSPSLGHKLFLPHQLEFYGFSTSSSLQDSFLFPMIAFIFILHHVFSVSFFSGHSGGARCWMLSMLPLDSRIPRHGLRVDFYVGRLFSIFIFLISC